MFSFYDCCRVITCSDTYQSPPQPFVFRTYEHTAPGKLMSISTQLDYICLLIHLVFSKHTYIYSHLPK